MKKHFLAILMAIGLSACGEDFARKLEQQDIMLPDSLKYVEVTEGFKPLYKQLSYSTFKPRDFKILHVKSPLGSGELLSNLVYGIQAAFSVDCSSSCLPSLKMTLLTTKVNKLNP